MKHKHNKMKNTAILYECATREMALCLQEKKVKEAKKIASILSSYLKDTELGDELALYKDLTETNDLDKEIAKTLLKESIIRFCELNVKDLEKSRSMMVRALSKVNGKMFDNFVPNYKQLATIYQLFNKTATPKGRILLENEMIENLTFSTEQLTEQQLHPIDALVYKNFVKHFNEKYQDKLNENQTKLVRLFVFSVKGKETPLKNFINEELPKIREKVSNYSSISTDEKIKEKTNELISLMESYKQKRTLQEKDILRVLKLQELVKEIEKNDYSNKNQ